MTSRLITGSSIRGDDLSNISVDDEVLILINIMGRFLVLEGNRLHTFFLQIIGIG